jgi:hypothetical protein
VPLGGTSTFAFDSGEPALQKFGLDSLLAGKPSSLELEIAKEKASSLGLTGQKLKKSLASYEKSMRSGVSVAEQERLIDEISNDLSALLVQRELMGLVHENLAWILETNGIPAAVLSRLGLRKKT